MGTIYYFTGTGNSLSIARTIAGKLNANLASIVDYMKEKRAIDDEVIGIVMPVYCMDIPKLVKDFLRTARFAKNSYIFVIVTCGGAPGNVLHITKEILAEQGQTLAYGTVIFLPDNSIVLPTAAQKKQQMLANEAAEADKICIAVADRTNNSADLKNKFWYVFLKRLLAFALRFGYKVDAKTIDTAKCIKCGNCERVCPANNIQKDGSKYVFGENCENCFACAHWCPVRALTLGRLTPDDKTHYTHPNVTLQDIIGQKNGTQSG